jgi:hypothetical protein
MAVQGYNDGRAPEANLQHPAGRNLPSTLQLVPPARFKTVSVAVAGIDQGAVHLELPAERVPPTQGCRRAQAEIGKGPDGGHAARAFRVLGA